MGRIIEITIVEMSMQYQMSGFTKMPLELTKSGLLALQEEEPSKIKDKYFVLQVLSAP